VALKVLPEPFAGPLSLEDTLNYSRQIADASRRRTSKASSIVI
jgi:hypothetical protein